MPTYTYTTGIPNGPNNPSTDQPNMKTNNDSNNSIWAEDHYGFNVANGGTHKQVRMPVLGSVPGSTIAGEGTLYTKTTSGNGELFYTPDATAEEYQLTGTDTANYSTCGTYGSYGTPPAGFSQTGGWTFLPGGASGRLLMQYGTFGKSLSLGTSGTIELPKSFASATYNIQITNFSGSQHGYISIQSKNATSFTFIATGTSLSFVFWTAIGL